MLKCYHLWWVLELHVFVHLFLLLEVGFYKAGSALHDFFWHVLVFSEVHNVMRFIREHHKLSIYISRTLTTFTLLLLFSCLSASISFFPISQLEPPPPFSFSLINFLFSHSHSPWSLWFHLCSSLTVVHFVNLLLHQFLFFLLNQRAASCSTHAQRYTSTCKTSMKNSWFQRVKLETRWQADSGWRLTPHPHENITALRLTQMGTCT